MEQSEHKPRHIARSSTGQPKEEPTKTYRVKVGQTWGVNPELQPGDTVELTEKEAAGFEDKLEQVGLDHAPDHSATPQAPAVPKRPA
jgi:hypothetical protein